MKKKLRSINICIRKQSMLEGKQKETKEAREQKKKKTRNNQPQRRKFAKCETI
jgi:hypothetical protein